VSVLHPSGTINPLLCDMPKLSRICMLMAPCTVYGYMHWSRYCLTLPCSQLYRCVFRNIGRGVVRQRAAVEAGWRTYVEQVWSVDRM
jgi:hypothetical protein